jgi:hypothetical protein
MIDFMLTALRLPFSFDAVALKDDLGRVGADEWIPHFNPQYYEGVWSGVSLRSVRGSASQLYADPSQAEAYADTPVLKRCGYFRQVLRVFECPLETVRLLRLEPGSRIREHRDFDLGIKFGVVRVHVPVETNPCIEFWLEGERVLMNEGESWFLDLSLPHRVDNRGTTARVHLVIDCVVNAWVKALLGQSQKA